MRYHSAFAEYPGRCVLIVRPDNGRATAIGHKTSAVLPLNMLQFGFLRLGYYDINYLKLRVTFSFYVSFLTSGCCFFLFGGIT